MKLIIDKIKLLDPSHKAAFEQWVVEIDYFACHDLPSVLRFGVYAVEGSETEYLETVYVSSMEAFEQDMHSDLFKSLVSRFTQLAEVTETQVCDLLLPGYEQNFKV